MRVNVLERYNYMWNVRLFSFVLEFVIYSVVSILILKQVNFLEYLAYVLASMPSA